MTRETPTERFLRAEVASRKALTAEQYAVLSLIVRHKRGPATAKLPIPIGVREIAASLGVSKPVITRAIKGLVRAAMAEKTRVKGDHRLVDVVATDKGREVIARMAG